MGVSSPCREKPLSKGLWEISFTANTQSPIQTGSLKVTVGFHPNPGAPNELVERAKT